MRNYWFYDDESGEEFFVQANSKAEAVEIIDGIFDVDELKCYGWVDDETAEMYGFDTY